ncbi:MAG TPA: hypothetical protein PK004_01290 [Smithella sp.]|jgi:hypothetical protein|nr:hypothetical protein [Smithella sp.]OQC53191.1 MAG: hypothetical protein BWX55_01279 [Deltaproteobacteria bacterium ADurb.Bin022]HNQ65047.1 hypothetical protein [Smithella sp.]HOE32344.1 hypothetical protein [Smithella sp.]HOG09079.1 hypothetical protein [Smithella sp.]
MSSDFSLEFKERYIHLIHAPDYEISPESNDILWAELAKACRKYKCLKVLTEGSNQKRRITSMDAYQSGAQAAESIPGMTLAICIDDYTPDDITQFFKNVAYNRGARIEFFNDKKKALAWLGFEDTE